MSHPEPTPLKKRLRKLGRLPSTAQKYEEILSSAPKENLLEWIEKRVHARVPLGTVLPMRAAVKHYLIAEKGYTEEELQSLLPKARGRAAKIRHALSVDQLALYHAAVDQIKVEPVHTILSLLFPTGMRISEITGLRVEDLHHRGQRSYFQFYGKGDKERFVPLNSAAKKILAEYVSKRDPTGPLFPGRGNFSITPHAIRKYTRMIAQTYDDLPGLSPHVLRATAASMWLAAGTDLITIQKLLGHKSLLTTQRYAQPSFDVLQEAVEKVAGKSRMS